MWECRRGVGGAGWVIFDPKLAGGRARPDIRIDVVDQQMAQLHKIDWAPDCEMACTGSWVLDTGMTENGAPLMGVLRKYGVKEGVGRVSGGNEQVREHKKKSVSNANSRFCDLRTLDGSNPEGSAIRFDMGIITGAIRAIDRWRR